MKKLKELLQQKMNASQYEKDGLKVIVNTQNEVILQFTILNKTFEFKDKSISPTSRIAFGDNPAEYIHQKIMQYNRLNSKLQNIINNELKNKLVLLMK